MPWAEVTSKRLTNGKLFSDGDKRAFFSSIAPLHYESIPDSGIPDTEINASPVRINNAQLDGWLVTQNSWHYALGKPGDKPTDGWVGFGGRQGSHWIKFRLARVGYLHYPSRAWDDIGGAPDYDRSNLSQEVLPIIVKPINEIKNSLARATWADIWTTPGGGSLALEWIVAGDHLKENIIINQAARTWITDNRPPATPLNETYFGFVFQIDPSDIPKWIKNGILQSIEGDFDDSDGNIEIKDSGDRLLGFMPASKVVVGDPENRPVPFDPSKAQALLRKRIWKDPDGNYYMLIGCRCDLLNNLYDGDLKFDPTWGQTSIQANTDDGNDAFGDWYEDGYASNLIWVAEDDDTNVGLSWQMPAIAASATIQKFYVRAYCNSQTGTVHLQVRIENSDPASAVIWSQSHQPANGSWIFTSSELTIEDIGDAWYFGETDTDPVNLATGLASLLASYGAILSGDRVNIGLTNGPTAGSAYMGFNDYSLGGGNLAQLYIEWTESSGVTVTPSPITGDCAAVNPGTVLGSIDLTPQAIQAAAYGINPAVVLGSLSLTPTAIQAEAAGVNPGVVLGSITLTPAAVQAALAGTGPVVVLGSVTLTPAAIQAALAGINPAVIQGPITLTPAAIVLGSIGIDPAVQGGGLFITPAAIVAAAAGINPLIVQGSITVTPAAIQAAAAGTGPQVIQGAITLTPAAILAAAAGIDPTVQEGGVFITPAPIQAAALGTGPQVVQGAITLTPAAIQAALAGVNPWVSLGSLILNQKYFEPELIFDGSDWYDLPLPGNNWNIDFYIYINPEDWLGLYTTIIGFGANDQNEHPSVILIECTETPPGHMQMWLEGAGESNTYYAATPDRLEFDQVGWYRLQFTKSGDIITLLLTYPDSTTGNMVLDLDGDTLFFELATLCGIRSDWWWNDPYIHEIVPAGTKIKLMSGDYKFGISYTDIARTIEAGLNDFVASIVNLGNLGGYITQPESTARAKVNSLMAAGVHDPIAAIAAGINPAVIIAGQAKNPRYTFGWDRDLIFKKDLSKVFNYNKDLTFKI